MAFPLASFRILYPAFAQTPDNVVMAVSEQALCLASNAACACSEQAWQALTAHLLAMREKAALGDAGQAGAIASASIDGVSVSFQQVDGGDSWTLWLGGTAYGQQALALLKSCSAGGFYVGGKPEKAAFTSVYGLRG